MSLPYPDNSLYVISMDDLVLGGGTTSPANLPHTQLQSNVDYIYNLLGEDSTYGVIDNYFRVTPNNPNNSSVNVLPGVMYWGPNIIFQATQTNVTGFSTPPSGSGIITDLVYISSSAGNIAIYQNVPNSFDYSQTWPLALVTQTSATTTIGSSNIVDVRPFLQRAISSSGATSGGAGGDLYSSTYCIIPENEISVYQLPKYPAKYNGTIWDISSFIPSGYTKAIITIEIIQDGPDNVGPTQVWFRPYGSSGNGLMVCANRSAGSWDSTASSSQIIFPLRSNNQIEYYITTPPNGWIIFRLQGYMK